MYDHFDKWEQMYHKYGSYGLAKKMVKLKSWRDYVQKYPYDYIQSWSAVKQLDELADFLQDESISVEDIVSSKLDYENFVTTLTPKQAMVWEGLIAGMSIPEIEAGFGFGANATVRWHKHQIKNKYLQVAYGTINEYICKECAQQWHDTKQGRCPDCDSSQVLRTKKDIPVID